MKNYVITQLKEFGIYSSNDTVNISIKITDTNTGLLATPSDVNIYIYNPDNSLITDDDMISTATGYYYYEYTFPSNSEYGIYSIFIETNNKNSFTNLKFVLLPCDICSKTRHLLGAYQQNDISDYKLSLIAWDSYIETLGEFDSEITDIDNYENKELLCEAVAYLTAYKIAITYKSLDKATLADIQSNRQVNVDRFLDMYEKILGILGVNRIGCGD